MPVILELRGLKQVDFYKFEASLVYIENSRSTKANYPFLKNRKELVCACTVIIASCWRYSSVRQQLPNVCKTLNP